jgi:N-formylglutamate amidohydrolase
MERVTTTHGDNPALIIAPHDPDDTHTGLIAEIVAQKVNGYSLINWGWERDANVDQNASKANCNDVSHCKQDVVREEFLEPLQNYVNQILSDHDEALIYILHGVGNQFGKTKKPPEIIVGYGAGTKPSHSCDELYKDAFLYLLDAQNFEAYEGAAGGDYAGRGRNNLNQLYRKHDYDTAVHSMQIEIVRKLRNDEQVARTTADRLAKCIATHIDFVQSNRSGALPTNFDKDWIVTAGCFPSI